MCFVTFVLYILCKGSAGKLARVKIFKTSVVNLNAEYVDNKFTALFMNSGFESVNYLHENYDACWWSQRQVSESWQETVWFLPTPIELNTYTINTLLFLCRYYTVQQKEDGNVWHTIPERVDPFATSYTVENLKPYTAYQFRIRATNDIGPSPYSNATETVRTLPAGK